MTIISAYQAVTDRHYTGLMTVTTQQRNILTQLEDPVSEPRKAFKRYLCQLLQTLTAARGNEIIVSDFNETIDAEFNGLGKIFANFQLVYLLRRRLEAPLPATYARGNRRLDFGLAMRTAGATALKFAGYEALNEWCPTNHRAYFFDFDTDKLFGNAAQVLAPPPMQILHHVISNKSPNIFGKISTIEQL